MTTGHPPRSSFDTALDDDADRLAKSLRTQWREEEKQRKIRDPIALPVRWQAASDEVMDHWANICRCPAGVAPRPPVLAGQLDEIVRVHHRIPSRRLVVLGRAGSGKTTLALRFVLDLLAARSSPADPVPVIFSLASWNPTTTTLHRWLTGQLERNHPRLAGKRDRPGSARAASDASTRAEELIDNDRILPVLDGFDEIPALLRRPALTALNDTDMPLLLTSRRTAYTTAVKGARALTSAAAVELIDLALTDLDHCLPRGTRKTAAASTAWDPVLSHLRKHPQHPASIRLATVLRTPLMVMLARTIYSDAPDRDPWVLLTDEFSSTDDLEDHLLDHFIPTVYRDRPRAHRTRVPHLLGHLARHLDQLDTRDLAWWQLGSTLPRWLRTCLIGLVAGLAFGLVDTLVLWFSFWYAGHGLVTGLVKGLLNGLSFGFTSGLGFGLVYGLRYGHGAREPSRARVRLRGGTKEMRKEFVFRLAIGLVGGFGFGFTAWLVDTLVLGLTGPDGYGLMTLLAHGSGVGLRAGLPYGLAVGLTFALTAVLETPVDLETAVGPHDLLHTNRTTTLFHLLMFGLFIGLAGGILCWMQEFRIVDWILFGVVGWLGGGLAYGLSLTAWGQWVTLSRIWLPLTGRLPWAVSAFLRDAHRRGVLRQAGAVYQFRHARLQEHLARGSRTAG
ncbi:NACHT domain-containing protein [Streptomyces sp. ID38640]|uniref:NACHT domain-containing protein n=1 Tax=Streptomyces sp. ID38640 TaxID=1265399 RepID=UPI00140EB562|nr:NACHT domain-containing protein [Streptomyces sp. ID38640]QIK09122.1 NACHT domain-containing protein [Streptomyces sp. ID38640]